MSAVVDYPHLRAWCRFMGSFEYYTSEQLRLAREENAPADAIYRRTENGRVVWHRYADVTSPETRWTMDNILAGMPTGANRDGDGRTGGR